MIGDNQAPNSHLIQVFYGGPNCIVEIYSTVLKLEGMK